MTMTKPTSEQVTFTAAGSGATLRNLVDKVRETISYTDFGGIANDSGAASANRAALNAAIARIASIGGGTLQFPDGDFYIDCSLTTQFIKLPSNCAIEMSQNTRIRVSNNGSPERYIVFSIDNVSNVRIAGGQLIGDKTNPLSPGFYGYGITVYNNASNIVIENVTLRDFETDGLFISDGTNIRVVGVNCDNNKRHGGAMTRNVSNVWIEQCIFQNSDQYFGFDLETESSSDITNIVFSECIFRDNFLDGLVIQKAAAGIPRDVKVSKCVMTGNGYGIRLLDASQFLVESCTFRNNTADNIFVDRGSNGNVNSCLVVGGQRGIYLLGSEWITISNNVVLNGSDDGIGTIATSGAGILKNNQIDGNVIDGYPNGTGIDVRGISNSVTNNKVTKVGRSGILVTGTNCLVLANDVSNCGQLTDNTFTGINVGGQGNTVHCNRVRECVVSQSGTAQAGALGSITLASTADAITGSLVGFVVLTTGGTGSGQSSTITAYNGSTKVATVSPSFAIAPDNTTTYEIIPAGNRQNYGVRLTGVNAMANSNDCFLGGKTGTFLDSGTGSSVANNR